MTRIDFLDIADNTHTARLRLAARLAQRALREGQQVFIACHNAHQQAQLDELLWTFEPESFLPHSDDASDTLTPIGLGHGTDCGEHHQVLINLQSPPPEYFSRFERLFELVCQAPDVVESTRGHWRYYKSRGYPLDYKKV